MRAWTDQSRHHFQRPEAAPPQDVPHNLCQRPILGPVTPWLLNRMSGCPITCTTSSQSLRAASYVDKSASNAAARTPGASLTSSATSASAFSLDLADEWCTAIEQPLRAKARAVACPIPPLLRERLARDIVRATCDESKFALEWVAAGRIAGHIGDESMTSWETAGLCRPPGRMISRMLFRTQPCRTGVSTITRSSLPA